MKTTLIVLLVFTILAFIFQGVTEVSTTLEEYQSVSLLESEASLTTVSEQDTMMTSTVNIQAMLSSIFPVIQTLILPLAILVLIGWSLMGMNIYELVKKLKG